MLLLTRKKYHITNQNKCQAKLLDTCKSLFIFGFFGIFLIFFIRSFGFMFGFDQINDKCGIHEQESCNRPYENRYESQEIRHQVFIKPDENKRSKDQCYEHRKTEYKRDHKMHDHHACMS